MSLKMNNMEDLPPQNMQLRYVTRSNKYRTKYQVLQHYFEYFVVDNIGYGGCWYDVPTTEE